MEDLVEVRATIRLPGLMVGDVVFVDPDIAYIEELLQRGYLVPIDGGE